MERKTLSEKEFMDKFSVRLYEGDLVVYVTETKHKLERNGAYMVSSEGKVKSVTLHFGAK